MPKSLSKLSFFICSTYLDLKDYRNRIIQKIESQAGVINAQEFFGARSQEPIDTCLEELERADVFILVLGPRYGSVEEKLGISFSEAEFNRAIERKIPIFAYVMNTDHPFPTKFVSKGEDASMLEAFRNRVQKDYTVEYFTNPDDLAAKVLDDLVRELPKSGFTIGQENAEVESGATQTLRNFSLAPKLFEGRIVNFHAKLDAISSVSSSVAEALSLEYGACIRCSVTPGDESIRNAMSSLSLYAEYEDAAELLSLAAGVELKITSKTAFGEYEKRTAIYGDEPYDPMSSVVSIHFGRRKIVVGYESNLVFVEGLKVVEIQVLS